MKKKFIIMIGIALAILSCQKEEPKCSLEEKKVEEKINNSSTTTAYDYRSQNWELVWQEEFNSNALNSQYWSKIGRGNAAWHKYISSYPDCYEISEGTIKLKGIVNPDKETEGNVPYLTGGIWTKDKFGFNNGIIEIRFKTQEIVGAWAAIWLLPKSGELWPHGGEIHIMEHFGREDVLVQNTHSHYTYDLGIENKPVNTGYAKFKRNDYNIIALEMQKKSPHMVCEWGENIGVPSYSNREKGPIPFLGKRLLHIDRYAIGK